MVQRPTVAGLVTADPLQVIFTGDEWRPVLAAADCCCSVVNTLEEALAEPHFRARGLFDERVENAWQRAVERGLWHGKYASTNHHEYFAEGVQSWFSNNRQPDHDHNHVDTRAELRAYDPDLAKLCEEVFETRNWSTQNPRRA